MGSLVRHGRVAVVVLVWASLGCGGDGGGGTEPPETGVITVSVERDDAGVSGVTVRLYPAGGTTASATAVTGSTGTAAFSGLTPGGYEVEVEVPTGEELEGAGRRSVAVQAGGTASVSFVLVGESSSEVVEVRLTADLEFSPSDVTIDPGTRVRWINDAAMFHTVTPEGHTEWTEGTVSQAGDTFEHRFESAGDFAYFCAPHLGNGMTGVVRVR